MAKIKRKIKLKRGRPPLGKPWRKPISVTMDAAELAALDELGERVCRAGKAKSGRSATIRFLVQDGLKRFKSRP